MSSYIALYREWRPRTFGEIVGQKHVSRTLVNALKLNKIAHAYLFSGPRGTGKTTTAKILAKALNCEEPNGFEPCNHCSACQSIDHGNSMDVLEIDAASNRGIDEIRDLREKVNLAAANGRYKVYIIDEVHMLTTEAFNALLKTLEEPPQRVVFVLATTEVHKIPLTILSRVQRFEFQRISAQDIERRLSEVCSAIGRKDVEPEALQVIAQKSEGGLRDALSILDQCLILDEALGVEQVYQVLGMVGETFSADLTDALLAQDYASALQTLSKGVDLGRDPRQILRELLDYLRQMLLCLATAQTPEVAPHLRERLLAQSQTGGLGLVLEWISILLQGDSQLKYAGNARLAAELLLIQTIYASQSASRGQPLEMPGREGAATAAGNTAQVRERAVKREQGQGESVREERGGAFGGARPAAPPVPTVVPPAPIPSPAGVTLETVKAKWPEVLEGVRKRKRSTHAFLLEGEPGVVQGNILTLVFKEGFSFHKDKVDQPENRHTVEEVLTELFGVPFSLQNVMENEFQRESKAGEENGQDQVGGVGSLDLTTGQNGPDPDRGQSGQDGAAGQGGPDRAGGLSRQDVVQKAVDIFGADLVVVKESED